MTDEREKLADELKSYISYNDGADPEWTLLVRCEAALRIPAQCARTPNFNAMVANLIELDRQRTPGPWRKSHEAIGAPGCVGNNRAHLPLVAECDTDFGMYKTLGPLQAGKNARFIVALENAWPKILAALTSTDRGEK